MDDREVGRLERDIERIETRLQQGAESFARMDERIRGLEKSMLDGDKKDGEIEHELRTSRDKLELELRKVNEKVIRLVAIVSLLVQVGLHFLTRYLGK